MIPVALLALASIAAARVYERCELARELHQLGLPRDQLGTWVCIAYHESRYDTAAQNYGSGDHGLLQISELYWCGPGKACGVPCSAFRDEDISDDVRCALQIYREHTRLQGDGFLAWVVYPHHCKQNAKKYIVDCDISKSLKNSPKFDDRSRHLKNLKSQAIPHQSRNPVTPRYMSINHIFQGNYVDEFERNYYDNNKQSNWLNFKVENIDELELPGGASGKRRPYFIESTTRPTTVTTLDPALAGIKPPSPRRIESNQFRRRKTFSQPQFLKNRFNDDFIITKTTPVPVKEIAEKSVLLRKDLSHNIFLNLSPSVVSKSLREFSPQEIKPTDLSRYHVKPQEEVSVVLTLDDLAQNPFLNSLPGLNFNSLRTELPFRMTNFDQNNYKGYTLTTQRPISSQRSSKQFELLNTPDVFSYTPKSSILSSQYSDDENIVLPIADLAENPFLSHLFHENNIKVSTESSTQSAKLLDTKGKYMYDYSFTTAKPTTESILPDSLKEITKSYEEQLNVSTKKPTSKQRGHGRYTPDFGSGITDKSSTEHSTNVPYSTRRYKTISRQRSNNEIDRKSTTALSFTEQPDVSPTANYDPKSRKLETSSIRPTSLNKTLYHGPQENPKQEKEKVAQSSIRTETSRSPDFSNRINAVDKTNITYMLLDVTSAETLNVSQTTSRPQSTSGRPWSGGRISTTSKPQSVNKIKEVRPQNIIITRVENTTQTTNPPPTTSTPTTRLPTTRRPYISRFQSTSKPLTASTLQTINKTEIIPTSRKPETTTETQTTKIQYTFKPEKTTSSTTTLRSWPLKRFWEESRHNTSTTPKPNFTWRRLTGSTLTPPRHVYTSNPTSPTPSSAASTARTMQSISSTPRPNYTWRRTTNSSLSSTTGYFYTTTQKPSPTSTEGSTTKTTQSIFDLYLRPTTRAPFKPFDFSSFGGRKSISIFSGGTTKPPIIITTTKKSTAEDVSRN